MVKKILENDPGITKESGSSPKRNGFVSGTQAFFLENIIKIRYFAHRHTDHDEKHNLGKVNKNIFDVLWRLIKGRSRRHPGGCMI